MLIVLTFAKRVACLYDTGTPDLIESAKLSLEVCRVCEFCTGLAVIPEIIHRHGQVPELPLLSREFMVQQVLPPPSDQLIRFI